MEIIIKIRCPKCNEEIIIEGKENKEKIPSNEISFLFGKIFSQKNKDEIKKDELRLGQLIKSIESGTKITAKDYVYDQLFLIRSQINDAKTKKELVKLRNKLKNIHIQVSEDLKKDFKEMKKQLFGIIDKKCKANV